MTNYLNLSAQIENIISVNSEFNLLKFVRIDDKYNAIITFVEPIPAGVRGGLLLDLECKLMKMLDKRLRVWCEVTADKSKLRQLRGIKVKASGDVE